MIILELLDFEFISIPESLQFKSMSFFESIDHAINFGRCKSFLFNNRPCSNGFHFPHLKNILSGGYISFSYLHSESGLKGLCFFLMNLRRVLDRVLELLTLAFFKLYVCSFQLWSPLKIIFHWLEDSMKKTNFNGDNGDNLFGLSISWGYFSSSRLSSWFTLWEVCGLMSFRILASWFSWALLFILQS